MAVLEVHHLKKIYTTRLGGARVQALTDVNFSVEKGEYVAIMGESGSGKTTLLNILAALDKPTEGKVYLKGRELSGIREKELAAFRRQNLGFVFQDFNLLDTFTLEDNIFLPLVLAGVPYQNFDLPKLDELSTGARSEYVQHTLYKGMALPLAVFAGLSVLVHRNTRHERQHDAQDNADAQEKKNHDDA